MRNQRLKANPGKAWLVCSLVVATIGRTGGAAKLRCDHDSLQAAWFSERKASLSEREQQRDARLRELWVSDAALPPPIVRYTFDAPFGFIEPNAAAAGYEAHAWRNNHQCTIAKREPGLFGRAIRHAGRGAIDTLFPADKTSTVSFWIKPERRYAKSLFGGRATTMLSVAAAPRRCTTTCMVG